MLRSFNRRKIGKDNSFVDQFKKISHYHEGRYLINILDFKKYLDLDEKYVKEIQECGLCGQENDLIDLENLIYFVKYGKVIYLAKKPTKSDSSNLVSVSTHHQVTIDTTVRSDSTQQLTHNSDGQTFGQSSKCEDSRCLTLIHYSPSARRDSPTACNIWKKSEVVKQERTVTYVAIDSEGVKQVIYL